MNLRSERHLKQKVAIVSQKKILLGFIVYIHAVCCSLGALIVGYSVPCVQNAFKKACSQQGKQVADVGRNFLVNRTLWLQKQIVEGRLLYWEGRDNASGWLDHNGSFNYPSRY